MKRPTLLLAVCLLLVTAGALAVRLPGLDRRPMHADEANQAEKAGDLWQTGVYEYDPHEHHGPTLYWLTLPSLWLSGAADFADTTEAEYRIVPVIFGAGLIVLLLLVADGLGRPAAVLAGVFAAVSPAMVYFSRYYIQETLLVFFTFGAIACGWRYVRSRAAGWAVAAGLFVGLMYATKETWVLAAAAAIAGLVLSLAWTRLRDGAAPALRTYLRPGPVLAGVAAAGVVAVAFYSSFGADPHGLLDSLFAYPAYLRRGTGPGIHDHPWYYYLELLVYNRPAKGVFWSEGLIVGLAAAGVVLSLCLRQPAGVIAKPQAASLIPHPSSLIPHAFPPYALPFVRFLAFYTLALTALYSAIPYKTPWCMLSFLDGMTLLAGVGAWAILRAVPGWPLKLVLAAALAAGLVHLNHQRQALDGRLCADPRNPYVYAHTTTDTVNLARQMERLAAVSPEGHEMVIHVVTPENYWPLPWYLRTFNPRHVGYWQNVDQWAADTAALPPPSIIILTPDVQEAVDAHLHAAYNQQMMYGLRPAVVVNVYAREDLWDAFVKAASRP